MKPHIMIVDDEADARDLMDSLFRKNGYRTTTAANGHRALTAIEKDVPDIMISDIYMPGMDGMALLERVTENYPDIATIMVTAHGTVEMAVQAIKKGAKDYILKPLQLDEVVAKVENISRLKSLLLENAALKEALSSQNQIDNFIGKSHQMMSIFELIKSIAPINTTTLIRGENGTGKELVARAIHQISDRREAPFIAVNCTAIPETLIESELFGHEPGAFTGAQKRKIGKFERANTGTIFLDEIGDISPAMQLKLLRVIQEKEFERVGGTEIVKVNVRIIAATNRDLEEAMEKGDFRPDLYYRLNVIPVEMPALRDRPDDIPLLVEHFLRKYNQQHRKQIKGVETETMLKLQGFEWPGNIRQLENYIERAVILSKSEILMTENFPYHIADSQPGAPGLSDERSLTELVNNYEKNILVRALKHNKNNKLKTAKKLGIHRSTLMSKLSKYGIS